ncbi:MAG TPA: TerC family protein [Acidobacteriota bacterium]|nr:TerC family protein [Acidobacteriota bacterium]
MLENIFVISTLVVLEGLLSADNALVLAILVRHLPPKQRKKALRYGIWGAFVFRLIAILLAKELRRFWPFRLLGGLYLIYIAVSHFVRGRKTPQQVELGEASRKGFWGTVAVVELTDIAFSVDSILAAVAMSDKLWVIYLGGVLGIVTMRFVAGGFLRLLDIFPRLETAAYLLVSWIGLKLTLETFEIHFPAWLFWSVMFVVFASGFLKRRESEGPSKEEELYREASQPES